MKLHIIVAALPPKLDGIGDYTASLAAELARSDSITVLTGASNPDPLPGVCLRTAFSANDPASVKQITSIVAEDKPDWVLLQYNPFSYGRWGLNLYLPEMMRGLRRVSPKTSLAVMVHEPFVPLTTPQFVVMGTWQRWQLWRLGQSADVIFFSIEAWQNKFKQWFPGKLLVHLPVGSNIPVVSISHEEAKSRLGIPKDTLVLGLFGTASAGRLLEWVRDAAASLRISDTPMRLLYVGPDTEKVRAVVGGSELIADGPASAEEVSRRFAAMDIYLVPYIDGISTRRTTLMTALQHGVATVGTRGQLTDALLEREDGQAFILADVTEPEAFTNAVSMLAEDKNLRHQFGQEAKMLYEREFAWKKITATLSSALTQYPNAHMNKRKHLAQHLLRLIPNYDVLNKPYYFLRPSQVILLLKRKLLGYQPASDREKIILPWGLPIYVRPSDTIGAAIFRTGVYDLCVSEILWRLLDRGETAVDAGANIGYMTSLMAKRVTDSGRVLSFEPHPQVFEELAYNVSSWNATPNIGRIKLYEMGLSKGSGTATLHVRPEFAINRGTSSLENSDNKEDDNNKASSDSTTCVVPVGKLDDVLNSDIAVGVMKIDVEGHELSLLQGASQLLAQRRVRDIIFEDHNLYPSSVTEYLEQAGYKIFSVEQSPLAIRVVPAQKNKAHYKYEAASYLATLDEDRARDRLSEPGYRLMQLGKNKKLVSIGALAGTLILSFAIWALLRKNSND